MPNQPTTPPPGGLAADHPGADALPILVAPAYAGKGKNTIRQELIPIGCWKLDDVRFEFGDTFVLPETKAEFKELDTLRKRHPNAPMTIFGHADPVSQDSFNKALSGRRAEAIYAVLVRDAARWEKLYNHGGGSEGWGTRCVQHMLTALGHDPGPVDGVNGPKTQAGVKSFQSATPGLAVDGVAGPLTREKLFLAYMDFLCPFKAAKSDFLNQGRDPGGKGDFQGCGELNPAMVFSQEENSRLNQPANKAERDRENAVNRRVLILLFRPGTLPSDRWPCPAAAEGDAGCKARLWSDGDERRSPQATRREFKNTQDTFACRFYHRLTVTSPCEGIVPKPTLTWIEFSLAELPHQSEKPYWPKRKCDSCASTKFEARLTDGPKNGALDDKAFRRFDPLPSGKCEIRFPDLFQKIEEHFGPAATWPTPAAPPPGPGPGPGPGPINPTTTKKLTLASVPAQFAPGVDKLTVQYDIAGHTGDDVVLTISSGANVVFTYSLTAAEKTDGDARKLELDGRTDAGKFLAPSTTPYSVKLALADGSLATNKETRVTVDKIELTVDAPDNKVIVNDPALQVLTKAKVFLKNTAGTGVVTPVEMDVKFTFTPNGANTAAAASYQYQAAPALTLGKTGDANALYWAAHPDSAATSADSFKSTADAAVDPAAGAKQGIASIFFLPSGVGGNKYKVKAAIAGVEKETDEFTVHRRITLIAYEMVGQSHVTNHGTDALIQPFYTADTFVTYVRGALNAIAAQFSIRYIGLWDHGTQAQLDWATHQVKLAAETPTAAETAAANGPAGPAQVAARAAIQAKANAWRNRIVTAYNSGLDNWAPDAGVPVNSLVAIEYEHPKYSNASPDSQTNEWTAFPWLQITVEGRSIHPDSRWVRGQGLSYGQRAYITAGMSDARTRVVIAHEAGHETKNQFKRDRFGAGDHTAGAGLMDPGGTLNAFTAGEKKILRGEL